MYQALKPVISKTEHDLIRKLELFYSWKFHHQFYHREVLKLHWSTIKALERMLSKIVLTTSVWLSTSVGIRFVANVVSERHDCKNIVLPAGKSAAVKASCILKLSAGSRIHPRHLRNYAPFGRVKINSEKYQKITVSWAPRNSSGQGQWEACRAHCPWREDTASAALGSLTCKASWMRGVPHRGGRDET